MPKLRLLKSVVDADGDGRPDRTRNYTYDNRGNVIREYTEDRSEFGFFSYTIATFAFDRKDNKILDAFDGDGDGQPNRVTTLAYDARSNLTLRDVDFPGSLSLGNIDTYTYDNRNNLTSEERDNDRDGQADFGTVYIYDAKGNLIEEGGGLNGKIEKR